MFEHLFDLIWQEGVLGFIGYQAIFVVMVVDKTALPKAKESNKSTFHKSNK